MPELLTGLLQLGLALATLSVAFPLQRLMNPPVAAGRNHWGIFAIQTGLLGFLFFMLLAILQRAMFSAGLVLALWLLLILVNNAKFKALKEPFVFSDFALFSQVFRFPRLYLPFLGWKGILLVPVCFIAVFHLGITFEPALTERLGIPVFCLIIILGLVASSGALYLGTHAGLDPRFDPLIDSIELSLPVCVWLYWLQATKKHHELEQHPLSISLPQDTHELPDIVVIQSESFFDARRLFVHIKPEVLHNFDSVRKESILSGKLAVPAWGANTMRSEFAFLSGIPNACLGVHRFNPYQSFAYLPQPSLPRLLRTAGYKTVCIHPHEKAFFGRDRVFSALGFDEFVDIREFMDADKAGPYVADAAVTTKIRDVLATRNEAPLFLFVITMENHGPLHLEKVSPGDCNRLYHQPPPHDFDDLTVYLRHLSNADMMIAELYHLLSERQDDSILCFYGDHVPSMPKVYQFTGFSDGLTDYFIWRRHCDRWTPANLDVSELGSRLLAIAGLSTQGSDNAQPISHQQNHPI